MGEERTRVELARIPKQAGVREGGGPEVGGVEAMGGPVPEVGVQAS